MSKKIILTGLAVATAVALGGCWGDNDEADARELCYGYPQDPLTDIYAAQYGRAGAEADLTGDGFINVLEWRAFCAKVEAEIGINPPSGGGGGGTSEPPTTIQQY